MALATLQRQAEPRRPGGGHPIHHGIESKLQGINATLLIEHRIAMKPRCDTLVGSGSRQ